MTLSMYNATSSVEPVFTVEMCNMKSRSFTFGRAASETKQCGRDMKSRSGWYLLLTH